ncbi:MAG: hypothetical protein IT323_01700 [Anaerolineae bacterium]|nr:hypothetical protein [Anaerolineae bacterium]
MSGYGSLCFAAKVYHICCRSGGENPGGVRSVLTPCDGQTRVKRGPGVDSPRAQSGLY